MPHFFSWSARGWTTKYSDRIDIDMSQDQFKRALNTPGVKRVRHRLMSPRLWLRGLVFWGGSICVGAVAVMFAVS